jgi:hypothetical protein
VPTVSTAYKVIFSGRNIQIRSSSEQHPKNGRIRIWSDSGSGFSLQITRSAMLVYNLSFSPSNGQAAEMLTKVCGWMIVLSEAGGLPHHHAEGEVFRLVKVAAVPVQPTAYIVVG